MTIKQEFILLCIYSDFARDQSKLIDVLERYNFKEKSELGQNLQPLLDNDYIIVSCLHANETPFVYSTTDKGNKYVQKDLNDKEVLSYVSKMSKPELVFKITEVLINRKNDF